MRICCMAQETQTRTVYMLKSFKAICIKILKERAEVNFKPT